MVLTRPLCTKEPALQIDTNDRDSALGRTVAREADPDPIHFLQSDVHLVLISQ